MNPAIKKVLADLDSLGDGAIKKRILGMDDEAEAAESPAEQAGEDAADVEGLPQDKDELSPELLEKLKTLLAE